LPTQAHGVKWLECNGSLYLGVHQNLSVMLGKWSVLILKSLTLCIYILC